MWLTEAARPKCFVELGTLHGVSYFTFCETAARLGNITRCFAVDSWKGDEHTGFYEEDVWEHVSRINREHYSSFSTLIRKTFDEALPLFSDASIDLLHIDGRHFYEDVRHDLESWLPKLSSRGVILLHDTNVHDRGFGVARLWREIEDRYPTFQFLHGNGLGIVAVGSEVPSRLTKLFEAGSNEKTSAVVREAYSRLGKGVSDRLELRHEQEMVSRLRADISHLQHVTNAANEGAKNLERQVEAASERAKNLERQIEAANERAKNLERQIEAAKEEAALEKSEIERVRQERAQCQLEIHQLRELAVHREQLLASTSWRATAPLRRLSRKRTRILNAFRTSLPHKPKDVLRRVQRAVRKWTTPVLAQSQLFDSTGHAAGGTVGVPQLLSAVPGAADSFNYQPLVSIIMPVFNVEAELLRRAIASVRAQTYPNWEICVCDDGSTVQETIEALRAVELLEPRLHVRRLPTNSGISAASNEALDLASGEFIALLDNDDELTPHALETCVAVLNRDDRIDVIYSDEDKLNFGGGREEPFFKPDWSPSLLREVMYVGHLLVIRRNLVEKVGRFDPTYDGVQDYELMLRLAEHTNAIHHVRDILYHWRRIPGSVAECTNSKPNLGKKQVAAVNAHLSRMGVAAQAEAHPNLAHRAMLLPSAREKFPRISIIIPTKDAPELISRCLHTIFDSTAYPNFEVVVVDNGTSDSQALATLDKYPIVRVLLDGPFNFSRANNIGVKAASGDVLVFLNNDTEILHRDWLEQMLFLLDDPDVGAVGPLLLYPNRTVQHAGVALGIRGTADHVLRGLPEDADGYFGSLACTREVSAVTFACAMVRREDYDVVGGLQELYQTHYQDVDFCLRLRELGRRILCTPRTRLVHHESATRGSGYDAMDRALLLDSWGATIGAGDPYSRWEPAARAGVCGA
jgi:glycosyltransferase involved in cell wall biosynthesis